MQSQDWFNQAFFSGSKKEKFTYVSNPETLQGTYEIFSFQPCTSALSLSSCWCLYTEYFCVLCPPWAIRCTSRIRYALGPDCFLFTIKEQRVSKRNALAIRLIHTVRNINYLLSLATAISVIIHKPLDMGCKKSSGFGHKPHWKAIHRKANE